MNQKFLNLYVRTQLSFQPREETVKETIIPVEEFILENKSFIVEWSLKEEGLFPWEVQLFQVAPSLIGIWFPLFKDSIHPMYSSGFWLSINSSEFYSSYSMDFSCPFYVAQKVAFSTQYLGKNSTTLHEMLCPCINSLRELLTQLPCEEEHRTREQKAMGLDTDWKLQAIWE